MFKNIFNQLLFQVGNYIIPLILLPFLINNLSGDLYQKVIIIQAIIVICSLVINYGFDIKGTSYISTHSNDLKLCADYIKASFMLKIFLFLIVNFIYLIASYYIFGEFNLSILFGMLWVFSYCFQFNWFHQGINDFKVITIFGVLPKIVIMPLVIFFVKSDADIWYYFFLSGISVLIGNILMCARMISIIGFSKIILSNNYFCLAKTIAKDGFSLFTSIVSTTLINNLNVFILPFFLSPKEFIIFNTAEKICRTFAIITTPVTNVLYPKIARMKADKEKVFKLIKKIVIISIVLFCIGYSIFICISYSFINLVFSSIALPLNNILSIMVISPFMIYCNNLFGTQIGLNYGKDKEFSLIVISSGFLNVTLMLLLPFLWGLDGAVLAFISTQVYILFRMYYLAVRLGFRLYGKS